MRRAGVLGVTLALALTSAPARTLDLVAPRYTREQMESALPGAESWLFVYGTRTPAAAAALRERATLVARRLFDGDSSAVRADREVTEREVAEHSVFLIGSPRDNAWTERIAPALGVEFTARGFRWHGRSYEQSGDVIHLAYPNPLNPQRFLLLVAGNSAAAMTRRGGGFLFAGDDWRIYRDGELVRDGRFAQKAGDPWRYDAALDRDLETEREQFTAGLEHLGTGPLRVRALPGAVDARGVLDAGERVLAGMDRLGLGARRAAPGRITLYRSLEQKGRLARNTRPEQLESASEATAALAAGRDALDLWTVASMRLCALGAASAAPLLEPAGVWLAGRFEGEPLAWAVHRLYFGRLLPTARDAAARDREWRSPLIMVPARALLARAVFESAGGRGREALLALLRAPTPGTLDSLCRVARVPRGRVEERYAALADSLARVGARRPRARRPQPWRPEDGFQRGVCLAHAVSLDCGYISEACGHELEGLRKMGADWVSLTPFGYLPSIRTPEIFPSSEGGVDEETDEAIAEAAARAHALGMRVWLKPHLWTRGWIGELDFGASGWPRFFERYRAFILHYALLADREGIDGLVVGHELVSASLQFPDRWRALIAEVRRVYGGTLTYGANWGEEVQGIAFWDALDVVGVSFYDPLAKQPTRSVATLRGGARRALEDLHAIAVRVHRPVLLVELGYAPLPEAAVRPWEERNGPPDLETQRACYQAVVEALDGDTWVAGAFWWKWFSCGDAGGPRDVSFSPRGKPAEQVMVRALRSWQNRAVQPPRPAGHGARWQRRPRRLARGRLRKQPRAGSGPRACRPPGSVRGAGCPRIRPPRAAR